VILSEQGVRDGAFRAYIRLFLQWMARVRTVPVELSFRTPKLMSPLIASLHLDKHRAH